MGTRGLFGFCYKGNYYIVFNHWDSFPSILGADLVKQLKIAIKNESLGDWKLKVVELKNIQPTPGWHSLTSLQKILDSGYIDNVITTNSPENANFIEYCYIINLDTECLDFSDFTKEYTKSFPFDNLTEW